MISTEALRLLTPGPISPMARMYAIPVYIAKRRDLLSGEFYYVPVDVKTGETWPLRCHTYQAAASMIRSTGRYVTIIPNVSSEP